MNPARMMSAAFLATACCCCASAPVHYYSLMPPAESTRQETTATCCNLVIRDLRIPAEVDRPEIVVRRSDDELAVLGNEVWIAPLRDELKNALLSDIRRQISGSAAATGSPREFALRIDVERFESQLAQHVFLQIGWRLSKPGPSAEISPACESTAKIDVGAGVPALVRGHQQALATVAGEIAKAIVTLEKSGTATCASSG